MRHAKESHFIQRLRRKIKRELKSLQKTATPKKLQKVVQRMHTQLQQEARSLANRGILITDTFDENSHTAPIQDNAVISLSKKIAQEFDKIHTNLHSSLEINAEKNSI